MFCYYSFMYFYNISSEARVPKDSPDSKFVYKGISLGNTSYCRVASVTTAPRPGSVK